MEITQEFVELMICPACQAKVELQPDGTGIKCTNCRRVYAIKDDIPDMLVEHATLEEEQNSQQ